MNLQHYVPYLKEKKAKVYRFMSCLPQTYNEKIEFEMTKNMDEAITKADLCYHLFKQRYKTTKNWQNKKNEKIDQRKKGFNHHLLGNEQKVILIIIIVNRVQMSAME